jgi:hypothetical protein
MTVPDARTAMVSYSEAHRGRSDREGTTWPRQAQSWWRPVVSQADGSTMRWLSPIGTCAARAASNRSVVSRATKILQERATLRAETLERGRRLEVVAPPATTPPAPR